MVLGNRISRFFKTVKQKFTSFVQNETTKKVLQIRKDEISEIDDKENRKRKHRWSNSNWLARIFNSTSKNLTQKEREVLAKNWFGNFHPVEKFHFKRGSKTKKSQRYE